MCTELSNTTPSLIVLVNEFNLTKLFGAQDVRKENSHKSRVYARNLLFLFVIRMSSLERQVILADWPKSSR